MLNILIVNLEFSDSTTIEFSDSQISSDTFGRILIKTVAKLKKKNMLPFRLEFDVDSGLTLKSDLNINLFYKNQLLYTQC